MIGKDNVHMLVQLIQMLLVSSDLFFELCQLLHLLLTDEIIFACCLTLSESITGSASISLWPQNPKKRRYAGKIELYTDP